MKALVLLVWSIATAAVRVGAQAPQPAPDAWKPVDAALARGLPQSAIQALEPIAQAALRQRDWPLLAKALAFRARCAQAVQGGRPEEGIRSLETEIAKAPREIVPVLETILAGWYWEYFQQNRWRFMQRTATATAPGKDFTTWDLPRLFAEIDRHYRTALASAKTLQAIPVQDYAKLLPAGTIPDAYRPTLYDVLACAALEFYSSGEQAAARPQDAFEVTAESDAFAPVERFLNWRPATTDTNSASLKAFRLYQDLLRFHQKDADRSAYLDTDLARLNYARNAVVGEAAGARFKAALEEFVTRAGDHEAVSLALHRWAEALRDEGHLAEAHKLAKRGQESHPASRGGKGCANLVADLEAPELELSTEAVWNKPWPGVRVRYRNLTRVHFRVYAADWSRLLRHPQLDTSGMSADDWKALLGRPPVRGWQREVPPTPDFEARTDEAAGPQDLPPGAYYLVASADPGFKSEDNRVSHALFWVSDLALVLRPRDGQCEGWVLWAESGEPVSDARVERWEWSLDGEKSRELPAIRTDTNGFYAFAGAERTEYTIRASHGAHSLAAQTGVGPPSRNRRLGRDVEQTVFFTDRAIYRPGQTIQYKGICLRLDGEQDNYQTLKGRTVRVVFVDANSKEIARQQRQCNDYGSFAGSFTAPTGGRLGSMQIRTGEGPRGGAWFNVEEYKRPKFQVSLPAPKDPARLGGQVTVTGQASAYTGAAVDGAQVRYRVVRQVRMPWWWSWGWRRQGRSRESQEIAHGTALTDADGAFRVQFRAQPDLSVPESDEPTFDFSVHADVTDSAGETRSAERSFRLGYCAIEMRLSADSWLMDDQPVEIKVAAASLDGEPRIAEGSLRIHTLQAPERPLRPSLMGGDPRLVGDEDEAGPDAGASEPNGWPLGRVWEERGFTTDKEGVARVSVKLPRGAYRAMLEARDAFGKKVTARLALEVLRPSDERLGIPVAQRIVSPKSSFEPGEEFTALWGTGYETGRAFVEIEQRRQMLQRFWTRPGQTQASIKQAVTEAMRGGFTLHVTQVRENRAYLQSRRIEVPWSNKQLTVKWDHFTSKLRPAQEETWTAVIQGPKAEKAAAEMVASLYDASLDAFRYRPWAAWESLFRRDRSDAQAGFVNEARLLDRLCDWDIRRVPEDSRYRGLPPELAGGGFAMNDIRMMMRYGLRTRGVQIDTLQTTAAPANVPLAGRTYLGGVQGGDMLTRGALAAGPASVMSKGAPVLAESADNRDRPADPGAPDLSQVSARRNLNETAFFFPQLLADSNGVIRLTFTMPEALTEWRFMGLAHDAECRFGRLEGKAVTAKELMVQPNPPRFLRESDTLEFTVKVSNQGEGSQSGKVGLEFREGFSDESVNARLGLSQPEQSFTLAPRRSQSFSWRLKVPDGMSMLRYKAVAAGAAVSDGEEGWVPVLARRILVTESLPLPIRGPSSRTFEFAKLVAAGKSGTLAHQSLTVQMVSQPAWYAVMALPYLMEFPHECLEQTFNRFYANALARYIAQADPAIRRVFDQWKGTAALESPLEKNSDLKGILLEETPWVNQAQSESQGRRNLGVLFDSNRLEQESAQALAKLQQLQHPDGGWSWFPGGPRDDYITLYIVTGFGRLRHLGVTVDTGPAQRALAGLDGWVDRTYREILKEPDKDANHLGYAVALYLYGRSFFLEQNPIPGGSREAVEYFLGQARKYWVPLGCRQSQGHLALALQRFGDKTTPRDILKSLKERSVTSEELGRFWRDAENGWSWFQAPIETHALMMEAFAEIGADAPAVEECQVWLLKQKQTQDWKTTKATADAVYALLLRGRNLLASTALVEVSLGGKPVKPEGVEAGTGYYEKRFRASEISPGQGHISVRKTDAGVSWGSVHWQYLEDMAKVTPYTGTPLQLKKALYRRTLTGSGPVLEPVQGPLAVGDQLVVRLELRVDRAMEYVHLKDQRGSGTEPLNVLSGYRYQDGVSYYESTRDSASHFFISWLPKGTHAFEYGLRVVHRGDYQTGLASIQCMYAPEFGGHSESVHLEVR